MKTKLRVLAIMVDVTMSTELEVQELKKELEQISQLPGCESGISATVLSSKIKYIDLEGGNETH